MKAKFPNNRQSPRRAAFTLVELLVVIAIIALLAALAFPMLTKVRERSVTAEDMGSLRQIAAALALYAGENNGRIPSGYRENGSYKYPVPGTETGSGTGDRWTFHECVDRYFSAKPVRYNPGSIYNFQNRTSTWYSKNAMAYPNWSKGTYEMPSPVAFSYNRWIDHANWQGSLLNVPNLSQFVIMGDTNTDAGYMDPLGGGADAPSYEKNIRTKLRITHQGRAALFLFADYHVELVPGAKALDYAKNTYAAKTFWRWW